MKISEQVLNDMTSAHMVTWFQSATRDLQVPRVLRTRTAIKRSEVFVGVTETVQIREQTSLKPATKNEKTELNKTNL